MQSSTKRKIKIGLWIALALLAVLLVALNFQPVDVNLIAVRFRTSLAVLIIGVLLIGFLLGWLGHSFTARKRKRS